MTTVARNYRLRVHQPSTQDPSDATVAFTLVLADLAEPPTLPGPIVRPTEGKTETQSWTFRALDRANALTSQLSDPATGRMWLLGRIVEVQRADGGGAWTTIGTGRWADLSEPDGPGLYTLQVEDERWKERNTDIFARADTTQFYPRGLRDPWRGIGAARLVRTSLIGAQVGLPHYVRVALPGWAPSSGTVSWIEKDLIDDPKPGRIDTLGNFRSLRLNILGVDCPIISFHADFDSPDLIGPLREASAGANPVMGAWAYTFGVPFPPGSVWFDAYLHAPGDGVEPTEHVPLHVGVKNASHPYGTAAGLIHPFDLAERLYTEHEIRIDPAAFAALKAEARYPYMSWRITRKQNLAGWLEENIYKPLSVVPFVDSQGRIAPKAVHLPQAVDPNTLFVFDASNATVPHPTWQHTSRDAVNILRPLYTALLYVPEGTDEKEEELPADRIRATEQELRPRTHDTTESLGPHAVEVRLDGLQPAGGLFGALFDMIMGTTDALAREVFERFGDGPQAGVIHGMESTASVQPGAYVLLDHDSLKGPNASTNTRTGKRLVQILQRTILPVGYEFEYLDAGPNLQPLAAPTVTVAQNAARPKHDIDITLSGVPGGATATVQVALDAAFTQLRDVRSGVGDGTITVPNLPSGTQLHVRALSTRAERIRSAWSATATVTTVSLAAPTGVAAVVSGRSITASCTPGDATYPLMPTLDGAHALSGPLPAGSTTYVHSELAAGTPYAVGFRHVDAYGGQSAIASANATTGTAVQLATPRRLRVLQGRSSDASPVLRQIFAPLVGLEVGWRAGDTHAPHRIQASTDPAFATVDREIIVPAGTETTRIPLPLKGSAYDVRVRAEREGFLESDWSSAVSAFPTLMLSHRPASDRFPGGWAFLTADSSGVVTRDIGSDDQDTDRAYYAVSKTGYPAVDASSAFIARSSLPSTALAGLTLAASEVGHMTVRFWNEVSGFGQSVRAKVVQAGLLYAECRARIVTSTATTVTVQVDAVPSGGTVELLALTLATLQTGAGLGVPVASGSQWVFGRPAFQAGQGEAVFRAKASGYQSDDNPVSIPEVGRDTVPLLMRASVQSRTATTVTVRVAVADPFPGGAITLTYAQVGTDGVTPASPQTIASGAVTADIATTGFVDFTVTRPAAGSGTGRVTFTATRSGRVSDSDAVDVPELPPNVPVTGLPPTATIDWDPETLAGQVPAAVLIRDWQGGTTGLQWRYRVYLLGDAVPAFSAYAATDGTELVTVAQHGKRPRRLQVQAKDSEGRESEVAAILVPPNPGGIRDDEDGLLNPDQTWGGDIKVAGKLLVDSAVVPAWHAGPRVAQLGQGAAVIGYGANNDLELISNAYADISNVWRFRTDGGAQRYQMGGTKHRWYVEFDGLAGGEITWRQALEIDNKALVSIGDNSIPTHVFDPNLILRLLAKFATTDAASHHVCGVFYAEQMVATTGSIQGVEGYTRNTHSSGTVNLMLGVIANVEHDGAGDVGTIHGVTGGLVFGPNSGGTITNYRAISVGGIARKSGSVGGVVTNAYGLYVQPRVEGTNRWAIYTEGTDKSELGGTLQVREQLDINSPAGIAALVASKKDGLLRWRFGGDGSNETGGNAGNNWMLARYSDAGDFLGTAIMVRRSTGRVGVGTEDPAHPLQVVGVIGIRQTAGQGQASLILDVNAGTPALVRATKESSFRWQWGVDGSNETGGNAGNNWMLARYSDAGAFLGTPILADRATGEVRIGTLAGQATTQNANDTIFVGTSAENFFLDRSPAGGTIVVGYNTPKNSIGSRIFQVYNNSTDRRLLFAVQGVGSSSGSNQVIVRERLCIDSVSGEAALLAAMRGTVNRWQCGHDGTTESGSNSGTDFVLFRYSDAGVFLGTTILADRATGDVTFEGTVTADNIAPSSRALKTGIRPLDADALALLRPIAVQRFRYRRAPEWERIGIVAEEAPAWLSGPAGAHLDMTSAIGVLIAAVQQLERRLAAIET